MFLLNMSFISRVKWTIFTGPLKKLFHYVIFQKFFHIIFIHGLCFTIHVI